MIAPFEIYVRHQSRDDDLEMNASNWWERDDADAVIAKYERYTDEFVASLAESDSVPGTGS